MKLFFTCFSVLLVSSTIFSQVSDENMEILRSKWRVEFAEKAELKAAALPKQYGKSNFGDSVSRQFLIDTLIVDNVWRKHKLKDPSNLGINKANMLCMKDYEKLYESYSALLISKLAEKEKELFIGSNKKWLTFIEDERALCGRLMQQEYSGGGSIHSLQYTERLMRQYRNRVIEIVDYLQYIQ